MTQKTGLRFTREINNKNKAILLQDTDQRLKGKWPYIYVKMSPLPALHRAAGKGD